MHAYICLTTTPTRFHHPAFLDNLKRLETQTYKNLSVNVFIPRVYRRSFARTISDKDIEIFRGKLKSQNSESNTRIIRVDEDYGPATKFIAPLIGNTIPTDGVVVIVDDDIAYNPFLVQHLMKGLLKYGCDVSASVFSHRIDTDRIMLKKCKYKPTLGAKLYGFGGFAFKPHQCCSLLKDFAMKVITKYPDMVIHDDAIITQYMAVYRKVICLCDHVIFVDSFEQEINRADGLVFQLNSMSKRDLLELQLADIFKTIPDIEMLINTT